MPAKPPTYYFYQDSIPAPSADSIVVDSTAVDTNEFTRQFTNEDSITRIRQERPLVRSLPPPSAFDTASVPYRLPAEHEDLDVNPISPAGWKILYSIDSSRDVFIEEKTAPDQDASTTGTAMDYSSAKARSLRPDWLLILIIFCLVMVAWLKLFYNKFLDQTMQALLNFQLSSKLLRDQNMFQRRVAFVLNLNFVLAAGIFIYLLFGYLQIRPFDHGDFICYSLYSGVIAGFILLRFAVLHAVGYIFQKQREFREYLHEILLIYKNLGIYLIPLVFIIAYIHEDYRIYLFYLGGIMLLASLVLRVIRGFQILVNRDVLIFYLILYLCTLEILPLLIIYRFFSFSVLNG